METYSQHHSIITDIKYIPMQDVTHMAGFLHINPKPYAKPMEKYRYFDYIWFIIFWYFRWYTKAAKENIYVDAYREHLLVRDNDLYTESELLEQYHMKLIDGVQYECPKVVFVDGVNYKHVYYFYDENEGRKVYEWLLKGPSVGVLNDIKYIDNYIQENYKILDTYKVHQ